MHDDGSGKVLAQYGNHGQLAIWVQAGAPCHKLSQPTFGEQVGEERRQVSLTTMGLVEVILEILTEHRSRPGTEIARRETELDAAVALTTNCPDLSSSQEYP
jgi:hypothetical protein